MGEEGDSFALTESKGSDWYVKLDFMSLINWDQWVRWLLNWEFLDDLVNCWVSFEVDCMPLCVVIDNLDSEEVKNGSQLKYRVSI